MAGNTEEAKQEGDVVTEEGVGDFDDDTKRAIAEVYKDDGNASYRQKDYYNAIHFYTEGLKVDCKDDELNAKMYSNRATANFFQGNYQDTIDDVKAATNLQPTLIKPMEKAADACVKLGRLEEALTWCDKGLAINSQNTALLDLKMAIELQKAQMADSFTGGFPGDIRGFPVGEVGVFPESVTGGGQTPLLDDLFSDKELLAAFQDPATMQAFQDISLNPENIVKYGYNPRLRTIIDKLDKKFGPAGSGPPPASGGGLPGGICFGDMFGGP